jgi:hypothetical protein
MKMFNNMEVKMGAIKVKEIGIHPEAEPAFVCFLNIAELRDSFGVNVQLEVENPLSLPMPFVTKHGRRYMAISHSSIMKDVYVNAPLSFRLEVLKVRKITKTQIKILSWIHLIDIYETTPMDETADAIFKHSLRKYSDAFIASLLSYSPKSRLLSRIKDSRHRPESWIDLPYPLRLRF